MALKFFNSLTRQIEEFTPVKDRKVKMYSCGPTVYDFAHIGNLRAFIFSDLVRRVLEFNNYKVCQVMNITDVGHLTSDEDEGEDKIEKAAQKAQTTAKKITNKYTQAFMADLEKLNIKKPTILPRATHHIAEQIDLISKIEKAGFTYRISDGIYFDTSKIKDYSKLFGIRNPNSKRRIKKNPEKRNESDFALWKFSSKNQKRQMEWDSPWGKGFPGWHIECTAMSEKYLGKIFDIHTGGVDHIPVHHKNEIAQSEAAFRTKLANFWLHVEFLLVNGKKMAKSSGNFYTLADLVQHGFYAQAFRYLMLTNHYRSKINFTWEELEKAQKTLMGIYVIVAMGNKGQDLSSQINKAIYNDIDIPSALSILHKANNAKLWLKYDQILGLKLNEATMIDPDSKIMTIIQEREKLRKDKKFKKADLIRQKLFRLGMMVEDTPHGPKIIKFPQN